MAEAQVSPVVNRPNVSWGAIFAGAMIALAIQSLLMSLGSGLKLAFDPSTALSLDEASLIKIGAFTIVSNLIAIFTGGYVAARFGGFPIRSVSALHGLCSWALVAVFSILLVESGMATMAEMSTNAAKGLAAAVGALPDPSETLAESLSQAQFQTELFDPVELNSRMGWVTFISLGMGAISSILGGLLGGRRKRVPVEHRPAVRIRHVA